MLDASQVISDNQPWNYFQHINKWIKSLNEMMIKSNLTLNQLQKMSKKSFFQQSVENYIKLYKQPIFDQDSILIKNKITPQQQQIQLQLQLPSGTLKQNLRVPLILTLNKADHLHALNKDKPQDYNLFIMIKLRQVCIMYGATLIYTSSKNQTNIDLLYEYILHRLYDFPLRFKADIINQETIFVPAGYDSKGIIQSEKKSNFSQAFNKKIQISKSKNIIKQEIVCQQTEQFFTNYKEMISKRSIIKKNTLSSQENKSYFEKLLQNDNDKLRKVKAQQSLKRHVDIQKNNIQKQKINSNEQNYLQEHKEKHNLNKHKRMQQILKK